MLLHSTRKGIEVGISLNSTHDKKRVLKGHKWSGITIHHTGSPTKLPEDISGWDRFTGGVVNWLTSKDDVYVSSHYIIDRTGKIIELASPLDFITYHAGVSQYYIEKQHKVLTGCNNHMIGIELIGDGNVLPYTTEQYSSCGKLCAYLCDEYEIQPIGIVGHEHISPGRKVDPGKYFDWWKLFTEVGLILELW